MLLTISSKIIELTGSWIRVPSSLIFALFAVLLIIFLVELTQNLFALFGVLKDVHDPLAQVLPLGLRVVRRVQEVIDPALLRAVDGRLPARVALINKYRI